MLFIQRASAITQSGAAPSGRSAASKKPPHHEPTAPRPRDKHTGLGGSYVRDPATGERRRATPDTDPKEATP